MASELQSFRQGRRREVSVDEQPLRFGHGDRPIAWLLDADVHVIVVAAALGRGGGSVGKRRAA
jgi:hypothetical protein